MDLRISVEDKTTHQLVKLEGDVTVQTAQEFEERIAELASAGSDKFVIDMSDMQSIDSRGAGMLVHIHHYGTIYFAGIQSSVREVLERLMLIQKFKICRKVAEAEKKITGD